MASNEKLIWDFFIRQGLSPTFAAAFIGNLWYESGQNLEYGAGCKEGAGTGSSQGSKSYTNAVNTKSYSEYSFVHDGIGYGLAQWTYYSRKQALYDVTVKKGISISDQNAQLNYLVTESEYKKTINSLNALSNVNKTNVNVCTEVVCDVFESPSASAKAASLSQRQKKAREVFTQYAGSSPSSSQSSSQSVTMSVGQAILSVAQGEVGTLENGSNNIKYNSDMGIGQGTAYCSTFLSWCAKKAQVSIPGYSGYCSTWERNAKSNKTWVSKSDLKSGDIVFFDWEGDGSADHVGILESRSGSTYVTIEGNTSNPNGSGEGVFRKNRSASTICGGQRLDGTTTAPVNQSGAANNSSAASSISYSIEYKEVTAEVKTSTVVTADIEANALRTRANSLLTTPTLVESPFIVLKIGDYTFGSYSIDGSFDKVNSSVSIDYPNYMTGIQVTKINGQVNQYTINMTYQIRNGDDPNLLDKIFSSVGYGKVYISYGDWNAPKFTYKEEEAIITKLTTNVDFANSRITYTLYCTSNALVLMAGAYPEPAGSLRPSERIHQMMYAENSKYHLQDVFTAFKDNEAFFKECVASDDVTVEVEAKTLIDPLNYINYLVTCMSPTTTSKTSALRDANYYLTIQEDKEKGVYFTIKKVSSSEGIVSLNNSDVYEVDVGYPGDTLVTSFKIKNDNSWSLLYNYSQDIDTDDYIYNVDADGSIYNVYSPGLMTSSKYLKTTETQKNWWTQMTQFPITATLTIKGLLRPAMLMSYVRVNALFYGLRHVSSGLYIITKQVDTVDGNGYRTTLSLTRVAGDLDIIVTDTKTVSRQIPVRVAGSSSSSTNYTNTNYSSSDTADTVNASSSAGESATSPSGKFTNSSLVSYVKRSPNHSGTRKYNIDTISIHCMAGDLSVESCGALFADSNREASSNYGIGSDGRIGLYVDEANRSWCTSSRENDNRAVTIEVANIENGEPWRISNAAYNSLIKLCADICRRNGIKRLLWQGNPKLIGQVDKQNMTVHRWFANKSCPGNWLYEHHGQIAADVNALLMTTSGSGTNKPTTV